jgi:hypothetical protein
VTWANFDSLTEFEKRNRLYKPRQIRLWLGEKRFLGPVRLIYRVNYDENADPLDARTAYDRWRVEDLMTGERVLITTDRLGKELNEMEAIAWAATCRR